MADGGVNIDKAQAIMRRYEAAVSGRANFDAQFQDIAERVWPNSAFFTNKSMIQGDRRTQKLFDSTPPLALLRFAASIQWMLCPDGARWHKVKAGRAALMKSLNVKAYFDDLNEALFGARYDQKANFSSQYNQSFCSIGAFGTGAVFVDDDVKNRHLSYIALPLSECYILVNAAGVVDTVFRPFVYTARQAAQRAADDGWVLPEAITKAASEAPEKEFTFLHAIQPNSDVKPWRRDYAGMKYYSCYIAVESKQIVHEGGFRTFPVMVGRYNMAPREVYGRSPAMDALPSILTLNEQKKTVLRAGQKVVDPPLLLQDDGALQAFDLRSGALNYGMLSNGGEPLVKPLQTMARIDIGLEMMQDERRTINDHFLVTLFQILVETPEMTATEALLRAKEKGALLAPTMGRLQSGMIAPLIDRELDLLNAAGKLPDMPDELIEAGGEYDIEYDTELTRAQKAGEGAGILRTFESVTPFVEARPDILDKFNFEECVDVIADVYGAPAKCFNSPEIIKKIREARQQQTDTQHILDAAPVAASAAKDLMQARELAGAAQPTP